MKIQFSHIDSLDLDFAKVSAYLIKSGAAVNGNAGRIARSSGVDPKAIEGKPKIQQLISAHGSSFAVKPFRTPLADRDEIPFLLDADERPISGVNAWLRFIWKRCSPKTVRTYAYCLFDFFQYLEAQQISWEQASDDTLFSYRRCQEQFDSAHKKHSGTRTLARNTIQLRLLTVAKFYEYAAKHGYIEKNPLSFDIVRSYRPRDSSFFAHLGKPHQKVIPIVAYQYSARTGPPKSLPHETIWDWITSIKNERDRLIAALLYQTGMRREEIILWRVSDIPESRGSISDTSWVEFPITGKGRKKRLVRISPGNFTRLRYWLDFSRLRILKRCGISEDRDHGFVWIAERDGHPLQPVSLNHSFTEISDRCGIRITPHVLRHSMAMETRQDLYEDGVPNPEKVLQLTLGHSSVVTTISIYGDVSPQQEASEADSNAAILKRLEQQD